MSVSEMLRKFPYIGKERNIKLRHDYIDIDPKFLRDLANNPEAAKFYNQFIKEVFNADFRDAVFYTNKKDQLKLFTKNNQRNRCIYNRTKACGKLNRLNDDTNNSESKDDED